MIAKIYIARLIDLKREADLVLIENQKRAIKAQAVIDEIDSIKTKIEEITYDDSIRPNDKFNQISEQISFIEALAIKIDKHVEEINKRKTALDKELSMLYDSIKQRYPDLSDEQIELEIKAIMNES